jgi:hypothetical protein
MRLYDATVQQHTSHHLKPFSFLKCSAGRTPLKSATPKTVGHTCFGVLSILNFVQPCELLCSAASLQYMCAYLYSAAVV